MKSSKSKRRKKNIDRLRDRLHKLIDSESLTSILVQKKSEELDNIILAYYKKVLISQDLKEP